MFDVLDPFATHHIHRAASSSSVSQRCPRHVRGKLYRASDRHHHPAGSVFEDDTDGDDEDEDDDRHRAGRCSTAPSLRSYRSQFILAEGHEVTTNSSDVPSMSDHGHNIYFTFQECHESMTSTAITSTKTRDLARRSACNSYDMADYRSSSLFHGDSSYYAPSSSAYFNLSASPEPSSSALDTDGRVVFKRQCLRPESPERAQDIWKWVRGVEGRRLSSNSGTPDSFVNGFSSSQEQHVNTSYLRTSSTIVSDAFATSPMPCPLPDRMSDIHVEDDSSFAYPSRCSSTTLENTAALPPRPLAIDDPGMQTFLQWLAEENETAGSPRFQDSPPVAADMRCYGENCMCSTCSSCTSQEQSAFRPLLDIRDMPPIEDGNADDMWSPPSLHSSSSSSPPFRHSPLSPGHSCSPSELRSIWDDDDIREVSLHHQDPNTTQSPGFLSFSPFTVWNSKPDTIPHTDLPSPSSFSHIKLHQPQPVRPIVLIRSPMLDPADEAVLDDTTVEQDVKLSLRSQPRRRRARQHPNLIPAFA